MVDTSPRTPLNQEVQLQIPLLPAKFGKSKRGVSVPNFFIKDLLSKTFSGASRRKNKGGAICNGTPDE